MRKGGILVLCVLMVVQPIGVSGATASPSQESPDSTAVEADYTVDSKSQFRYYVSRGLNDTNGDGIIKLQLRTDIQNSSEWEFEHQKEVPLIISSPSGASLKNFRFRSQSRTNITFINITIPRNNSQEDNVTSERTVFIRTNGQVNFQNTTLRTPLKSGNVIAGGITTRDSHFYGGIRLDVRLSEFRGTDAEPKVIEIVNSTFSNINPAFVRDIGKQVVRTDRLTIKNSSFSNITGEDDENARISATKGFTTEYSTYKNVDIRTGFEQGVQNSDPEGEIIASKFISSSFAGAYDMNVRQTKFTDVKGVYAEAINSQKNITIKNSVISNSSAGVVAGGYANVMNTTFHDIERVGVMAGATSNSPFGHADIQESIFYNVNTPVTVDRGRQSPPMIEVSKSGFYETGRIIFNSPDSSITVSESTFYKPTATKVIPKNHTLSQTNFIEVSQPVIEGRLPDEGKVFLDTQNDSESWGSWSSDVFWSSDSPFTPIQRPPNMSESQSSDRTAMIETAIEIEHRIWRYRSTQLVIRK